MEEGATAGDDDDLETVADGMALTAVSVAAEGTDMERLHRVLETMEDDLVTFDSGITFLQEFADLAVDLLLVGSDTGDIPPHNMMRLMKVAEDCDFSVLLVVPEYRVENWDARAERVEFDEVVEASCSRQDLMGGLSFTRKMRSAPGIPNPFVPIVVMTGHSEERHILQARDTGVTEFLVKPMTVRSVYSRLCSIVERPRDFVNASGDFGPDRRRRDDPSYHGPKRREADGIAVAKAEAEATARKNAAAKDAVETGAAAKVEEVGKIEAENETKANDPVDPFVISQEELAKRLPDTE